MKLLVLRECYVIDDIHPEAVAMMPGDTIDIADKHAHAAILRGLAEPFLSKDDAQTGAPPRSKAAARGSPEWG